jgi:hypothetical protein
MADPGPSYSCTSHKLNVSKDIGWTENSVDSPFLYQFLRPERAIRAGSGRITPLPYNLPIPQRVYPSRHPFYWRFTCLKSGYSKCGRFLGLDRFCRLFVRRMVPLNRIPPSRLTHPRSYLIRGALMAHLLVNNGRLRTFVFRHRP